MSEKLGKKKHKENDKKEETDSLLHIITNHFQRLYKVTKICTVERFFDKSMVGEKDRMKENKETDKQEDAEALLHGNTCHTRYQY